MYDRVLIGVRGEEDDRRAIALARRLVPPPACLTLVHVSVVSALGRENEGLELELDAPGEPRHAFARQLELCGGGTRLLREHATSVGAGLQAAAERIDADLLVIGSTQHGALDHLLCGDDVGTTLARTRCALAVADDGLPRGRMPISTIGVAYDGTPEGKTAAEHAKALADSHGARLTPLYVAAPHVYATGFGMVAPPVEDPDSVVKAARMNLGTVAGERVEVIYGDPATELAQFSGRVDLLVCGSRRRGAVRRLVLGSTALALSRNARCPLVIAPPPEVRATPASAVARAETASASTAAGG